MLQQFKAAGLAGADTQTYTATQPTWHPTAWSVTVTATAAAGSGARDVLLESAFPTSGSRLAQDSLRAPLATVGATADAALPDIDVKGKVAVQTLHPQGGAFSERTRTTERAIAKTDRAMPETK